MKISLQIILILLVFLFHPDVDGQEKYPRGYFRSPIDFPIRLSGSFGELRKNHFHSGIDIRTMGSEGRPVYAVAEGYVSRIVISPGGYGKAIYINHPNGYTTVYCHLKEFNRSIGSWIRKRQYKEESFEQDVAIEPGVLEVGRGDIIAYSGNSGSSEGPHLHFEVRDSATQETVDPLLFGFPFSDQIAPKIKRIRIFPATPESQVNMNSKPVTLTVNGNDGRYTVSGKDQVTVSGDIIFAIESNDYSNDNEIRHGISTVELTVDDVLCFRQTIDRFSFAETRYINAILDYPTLVNAKEKFMRSYVAPNNKLKVFHNVKNRGIVRFDDSKVHQVRYTVKDVSGNRSDLKFSVVSQPAKKSKTSSPVTGKLLKCQVSNQFSAEGVKLDLPADALYEDLDFIYSSSPALENSFSPVHHLHNDETPVHTWCDLWIKPEGIPSDLLSKALIVKVSGDIRPLSVGGKWEDNFLKTRIRDFGDFTVMLDTIPPVITPVNITNQKQIAGQRSVEVKIHDELSGIKTYRGTLNGAWILMDFDAKSEVLEYKVDDDLKTGNNDFQLVVSDKSGNETTYKAVLIR